MLAHDEPPGYRLKAPRQKVKLERFLPIIHEILKADKKALRRTHRRAHF